MMQFLSFEGINIHYEAILQSLLNILALVDYLLGLLIEVKGKVLNYKLGSGAIS